MITSAFPGASRTRQDLQGRLQQLDSELSQGKVSEAASFVYPTPNDSDWNFVFTDHPRFEQLLPKYPGTTLEQIRTEAKDQACAAQHTLDAKDPDRERDIGSLLALGGLAGCGLAALHPLLGAAVGGSFLVGLGAFEWHEHRTEQALLHQSWDGEFMADKLTRWGSVLEGQH